MGYQAHKTSVIDPSVVIGDGTKIWHFTHIMTGASIGKNCTIGQNCYIEGKVGDNVKIQNNVSVYKGVTIRDSVFLGPSCVFTNVYNPRAFIDRKSEFLSTIVCEGATIGANATVRCGVRIGEYAFVGAGSVVLYDVEDYEMVVGNPAHRIRLVDKEVTV